MRQQPISQPFPFGNSLVHQRLAAGFDHRLAHFRSVLRRDSGSYQSCRPLPSIVAIQASSTAVCTAPTIATNRSNFILCDVHNARCFKNIKN
jgi:hypothetical protein